MQTRYSKSIESKKDPGRWTKEMIKRIWMISWNLWDSRNTQVHKTTVTRKEVIIAQLDDKVRNTHNTGQQNNFLPHIERGLFRTRITAVFKLTQNTRNVHGYMLSKDM